MTLILELTPAQEAALRRRAADAGQQPADFLLTAAGITSSTTDASIADASIADASIADDEAPTGSAYDLFRGLIGRSSSLNTSLSENTGEAFATLLMADYEAEQK